MAKNYFGITDPGLQRNNNEDAFIAAKLHGQLITACVIDGLGGYEGGEIAAALAKDAISKTLSSPAGNIRDQLVQAFVTANKRIQEEKQNDNAVNHMACVVTLALVDTANNKFHYAHVGDTRLYLLRDSSLVKITNDQSFVGFLEDNGRISEEEAMTHPKRNEINKALGFDAVMDSADYFETGESPFLPGDTILLCSDGLSDMITSSQMKEILNSNKTLEEKGQLLVHAANEAGGMDNITVVLVYNDKKQARPVSGKPGAQKKTPELIDNPETYNQDIEGEPVITSGKSNPALIVFLSVALAVAIATIAWLLYPSGKQEEVVQPAPLLLPGRNNAEKALADSLQSSTIHEISVEQKAGDPAIMISDTIFISRDSLILHGNGMTFRADSAYNGPVFVLSENCRYVLLDSIRFQNFSNPIISNRNNLRLKQVRFINCQFPVLQPLGLGDSAALNGLVNYPFKNDSTNNNHR